MVKLSEKAVTLLKGKNFAFIATNNKDGSPQVTPVWADTDGSSVLVNTAMGRVKERNVSRDPRVAVSLYDASNPYDFVSIDGIVKEMITGKQAHDHIDSLSLKYTGNGKYKGRNPEERRVILVIQPSRIRGW